VLLALARVPHASRHSSNEPSKLLDVHANRSRVRASALVALIARCKSQIVEAF
jgi:hypothetical protein